MSQHVINCRIEIDGLHVKRVGTFSEGATFSIESMPPALVEKCKNGDVGKNKKGQIVPICSFMTPHGSWIPFKDAYMPQFGVGKPPPDVEVYESSKKVREEEKPAGVVSETPVTTGKPVIPEKVKKSKIVKP